MLSHEGKFSSHIYNVKRRLLKGLFVPQGENPNTLATPPFYCSNDQPFHDPLVIKSDHLATQLGSYEIFELLIYPLDGFPFYCATNNVTPPYKIIHPFALRKKKWQSIKIE